MAGSVAALRYRSLRRYSPDQVRWVGACTSQPGRGHPNGNGKGYRWRLPRARVALLLPCLRLSPTLRMLINPCGVLFHEAMWAYTRFVRESVQGVPERGL